MRRTASILHLDLDAFFASVEQRDKPSLRGKPVVVGGTGHRGVVATASYEARAFGVRSAMSSREARSLCPNAAFLTGRFDAYREASSIVMGLMREISPLVEPLSLDEAFVDLAAADLPDLSITTVTGVAEKLRTAVLEATGGLNASVGLASSKFLAKIASDLDKPDGLRVIEPGTELELLSPMAVRVIPGVGPATTERLHRIGLHTVAEVQRLSEEELVSLLGRAQGSNLWNLAWARDDRAVVAEREAKSVSVEGTYESDITDRALMGALLTRQASDVARRVQAQGVAGRTVSIKVRLHDFTTFSRSTTLGSPTDDAAVMARAARKLLDDLDTAGGVRLLGVGVSGLTDWVQDDLFTSLEDDAVAVEDEAVDLPPIPEPLVHRRGLYPPGVDVVHDDMGRGWVWGSGRTVVTVRFETATTGPGPVRSYALDDPALRRWEATSEAAGQTAGDQSINDTESPGLA